MPGSSPAELKLTPELIEFVEQVVLKEAPKHCGPRVSYDDAEQEALLQLLHSQIRFDPSRGASEKTLIYTIVKRAVMRFATREANKLRRLRPLPKSVGASDRAEGVYADATSSDPRPDKSESHAVELERSRWTMDSILMSFGDEASRTFCRTFIECDGNVSEMARRLGLPESTVRYRRGVLWPKLQRELLAAGFEPSFLFGEAP